MGTARIVVVGSSNTDMVVKTERIPAPGETVLGEGFVMVPGGKGANQAVAAARLGAEATFVARLGADVFGDQSAASISAAGVDTTWLARDPSHPTGVALIFVDAIGQNSIVVAPGANMAVSRDDVDRARPALERANVLVLQCEIPIETVGHAIELGKELGKTVVLNPAPARPLPEGLLLGLDVVTPNEVEACTILGHAWDESFDPAQAARELLGLGASAAIITLGARGAVVAAAGQVRRVPPRAVRAVDTTAAGDCFTGALACALGEGASLDTAVDFATAAAAISVTRMGAMPSLPSRREVEALLGAASS
jgi:ribokinase